MEQWQENIQQWIESGSLRQAIFSQLRRKDASIPAKTVIRPIELKGNRHIQFEYHFQTKVTHENVPQAEAYARIIEWLEQHYRQALFKTNEADAQLLFSKKGKATMLIKPATAKAAGESLAHNRQKQRVVQEGELIPFMIELGIMTKDGQVHAKKQDKFRQINRFLEMVSDVLPNLPTDREIKIVDFGCGKSYLTFALYHLLAIKQKRQISVVGLDLKEDVIAFCKELANKLGYEKLHFQVGDIAQYEDQSAVDMVVTLHACDTATDAALVKAVEWGASLILSVPCCQHELFRQVANEGLKPLLSHGLLKERFSALATDAVRAQLLEVLGYKTQLLEFIDPEHTPKNMLIRAVRGAASETKQKWDEYVAFRDMLRLSPYLERALASRLQEITTNVK
ncbi:methyltransferase [Paenibacillus baekrokdamisoli]|uniref:Methyltransferase n=1 Tax=Paenibacillus baekrokdamisoli TaxID=1712516 RepID=A0A3G9JA78_9BACL|nr:SAM-dependent methyltransferase [Paenibacillus baekrokdamisoli]MBB3071688.1 SAM-dependent methyltransferase [Paenibacillus baekrokdamisoli]BBH21803.1 methyltransferase [Paenibacillus baekrokdamisoli]